MTLSVCSGTSFNLTDRSKNSTEQDDNSVVCTTGIPHDRITYQVLSQLFVVGDDAIMDDNKL